MTLTQNIHDPLDQMTSVVDEYIKLVNSLDHSTKLINTCLVYLYQIKNGHQTHHSDWRNSSA